LVCSCLAKETHFLLSYTLLLCQSEGHTKSLAIDFADRWQLLRTVHFSMC
ncbi:unnamed protein product, partial [Staurois parvus]